MMTVIIPFVCNNTIAAGTNYPVSTTQIKNEREQQYINIRIYKADNTSIRRSNVQ